MIKFKAIRLEGTDALEVKTYLLAFKTRVKISIVTSDSGHVTHSCLLFPENMDLKVCNE